EGFGEECGARLELDEVPLESAGTLYGHLRQPLWGPLVTGGMPPGPRRGPGYISAHRGGFYAGAGGHGARLGSGGRSSAGTVWRAPERVLVRRPRPRKGWHLEERI